MSNRTKNHPAGPDGVAQLRSLWAHRRLTQHVTSLLDVVAADAQRNMERICQDNDWPSTGPPVRVHRRRRRF